MLNSSLCRCVLLICFLFFYAFSHGQTDSSSLSISIDSVIVAAPRIPKPWIQSATSNYQITGAFKEQLAQNSLQELLVQSPSVFALNANNRAQDLRISIRGFGSRAAFGVRGVKIIVDGIPETTADGQGQLDNLNLGIIERIEVLNNGSAALYGNASGGVLNILTTDASALDDQDHFTKIGIGFHAYGGQQYQLTQGIKLNKTSIILHGNHHQGDGYRAQSGFQSTNGNLRIVQQFQAHNKLEFIANYMNSPQADDPGGVDFELYGSDPRAARDRNVQFMTGEEISQFKTSLRYEHRFRKGLLLNTYAFYTNRDFFGRLPFGDGGIIDLNRHFFGRGTSVSGKQQINTVIWNWQAGGEFSSQFDQRKRFVNEEGVQGELTLDQEERFTNVGLFWVNDFTVEDFTINLALRYDWNRIKAIDDFLTNGDDSGQLNLNDFNYSFGFAYQINDRQRIFLNLSSSFETPTLNELSNNPDGSGFNPDLQPQTANHLEIGFKTLLLEGWAQVSFFYVDSQNELLPFEIEAFPGRTFFRNVGSTQRLGLESVIRYPVNRWLTVHGSLAYHYFTFDEYELDGEDFQGNRLPGLPNVQGNIQVELQPVRDLQIILQQQWLGEMFTNDSNTESQTARGITNASIQYTIKAGKVDVLPYFGVNNLSDTQYADNIRINAFGGRFYEAAPTLFWFGGLRVNW
ncbi:MAG: TonB-dependent receptor [Bacteroidota bacterium]